MKRTLVLLCLLALPGFARADLLIQRIQETVRFTGENGERSLTFSGFVLRDLDLTNGAAIRTIAANGRKLYEVNRDFRQVFSALVPGANGRLIRVIAEGVTKTNELDAVQIDGLLVKGVNATLPVSATRQFAYPRVLRGTSYRVDSEDGQYRVTEIKTTRTYSQTDTGVANGRGEDVEAALARIVQRLEAAGYRPL
jgi:hypothetical protein